MPSPKKFHETLASQTQGHYIGPMPPHEFVNRYMPWNKATPKKFRNATPLPKRVDALRSMADLPERQRYAKLIEALSGWPQDYNDNQAFIKCSIDLKDSHSYRDVACGSLGVDISAYNAIRPRILRSRPQVMDFANLEFYIEDKGSSGADAFVDPRGTEDYDEAQYFSNTHNEYVEGLSAVESEGDVIGQASDLDVADDGGQSREVKVADEEDDILDEDPAPSLNYPFENNTAKGRDTRGQIASYAGIILAAQFRGHLFSILLCGRYARFIHWDRSAAVVTRRFNFVENPLLIFDFFKRFSQMTETQRGIDPNVKPATKVQAELARKWLDKFACEYWLGRAIDVYQSRLCKIATHSFFRLRFDGTTYIVPAPVCDPTNISPFGRSSRARLVYQMNQPQATQLRYMKDYWREPSPYTLKESDVYLRFEEKKVEHVAQMSAGGDTGWETRAHAVTNSEWVTTNKKLRTRHLIGHLIFLATIGRALRSFRTAHQLTVCLADGMEGHDQALKKAKVLHRDISASNIMMTLDREDRRGFLIDWDHCVVLDLIAKIDPPTRVQRTGTWQFLSAYLLGNPNGEHTPIDDHESALHVLMWMALCHLKHDMDDATLEGYLKMYDAQHIKDGYMKVGSREKKHIILLGGFVGDTFDRTPIWHLISQLCRGFAVRYEDKRLLTSDEIASQKAREERLQDVNWMIKLMREEAEHLPKLLEDEKQRDWIDNRPAELKKRKREGIAADDEVPPWKQSKMFDGLYSSSNAPDMTAEMEAEDRA